MKSIISRFGCLVPVNRPDIHFSHMEVALGPMCAGKSAALLKKVNEWRANGLSVCVLTHDYDTRFSKSCVVSRNKENTPCTHVSELTSVPVDDFDCIAIDEAQFFDGLVKYCVDEAGRGKKIFVSGLDYDASGLEFGEVLELSRTPDVVVKQLTARCDGVGCLERATRTQRLVRGVTVGNEEYSPRCLEHFEADFPEE